MPTIKQLPTATSVAATDLLPLSQGGATKSLAIGSLLSSVQPAIALATGKLLGRVSSTAGGPEPVGIGTGLAVAAGTMTATGSDHTAFPLSNGLVQGDEVVVNSNGIPKRMQATALRTLFTAGAGVTIDGTGTISAASGGSGSVSVASASTAGVVKVGTGLAISAQGTLTTDGSVVALRSSLAGVALSGAYTDLGGKPTLGQAAAMNVGTAPGTVASGADARIAGAVQAAALGVNTVTAGKGRVARSLADHLSDKLTVADLGVTSSSPTIDQSSALQAAQDAMQGAGGGTLRVGAGSYLLGSNVYTAENNTWVFESGASLSGAGQIDAVTDGQALGSSGQTLARLLSGTGDEHGQHVSLRLAPTTGGSGYEKTAVYGRIIHNDPSAYDANGNLVTIRDGTVFEGQASIATGNLTGRVWGINTGAGPDAGADGYAVGAEFGVMSRSGKDAGRLGTATSKIGVHVVAYGTSTATAALVLSSNGTTFQDGFVAQTNAVSAGGRALSIRPTGSARTADLAYIAMDGSAAFTSLTVGGVPVSAGGTAGVASFNGRTAAVTLTSADVGAALGYTAYSAANPAGFQTAAQLSSAIVANVSGVVAIANGGTGGTTASAARSALGLAPVAASGSYGDLTNAPPAYVLPMATASTLGGVRPDGTTITVNAGVLSAGAAVVPVTTVSSSGTSQTLTAPASGSRAFDITLTGNCVLSLAGGTAGEQQTITVYLRQDATAGRVPVLPAGVKWPGGAQPSPNSSAGTIDVFRFTTPDAGATWFGSY